ncbi:hypothetical protein [Anabaena sp. UHCC 0204]|uniref:hypothetical protein n=1 Tax=Anabaena sp. UHCC 0204 TaxID=2590009 RepID=UPI00144726DA|nr:hypothetical protein [Anabaena sp. UHCC 0204]MTJ08685.1 hypothetical protein [Anabaena sp. UHCC 0204]
MKDNDIISVFAFLTALGQLDTPLPFDIQSQINNIGKAIELNSSNIRGLDLIAESYPDLDRIYQQEVLKIRGLIGERNKSLPPEPLNNKPTNELTNAAVNVFNSYDSVDTAKKVTTSNFITKILAFITGNANND